MAPPDVPVIGRHRWIRSPGRIPIVVSITHCQYGLDASALKIGKDCPGVTLPQYRTVAPPVIAAVWWAGHGVIPPCPIDNVWISFDLSDSRCAISAIGILPLPA